jgi:hypothetical protein
MVLYQYASARFPIPATIRGGPLAAFNAFASRLNSSVVQAERLAYAEFPKIKLPSGKNFDPIHNGQGDALKHCYLSALLFKEFGEDFATDLMNAHEEVDGNPPDEKFMDLFNNAVGRHIAAANPGVSNEELGKLCLKAVQNGETKVLAGPGQNMPTLGQKDDYPLPPPVRKGEASPDPERHALNDFPGPPIYQGPQRTVQTRRPPFPGFHPRFTAPPAARPKPVFVAPPRPPFIPHHPRKIPLPTVIPPVKIVPLRPRIPNFPPPPPPRRPAPGPPVRPSPPNPGPPKSIQLIPKTIVIKRPSPPVQGAITMIVGPISPMSTGSVGRTWRFTFPR